MKDEKNRQNKRYPVIKLRPLITRGNYMHFKEMYLFSMRKEVGFRFVFLRDHYDAITNTCFEKESIGYYQPGFGGKRNIQIANLVLSPRLCRKIWVQQYEFQQNILRGSVFKKSKNLLRSLDYFLARAMYFDCGRSRRSVLIDPYGYLAPCEFLLLYKYGHCFYCPQESWFSRKRKKIREKITDGLFPICKECNRYGLYRPVFPITNNLSKWYYYLLHHNGVESNESASRSLRSPNPNLSRRYVSVLD